MIEEMQILGRLLASLAVGLLIGTERGWSDREQDEGVRVAGMRTFSLLGLLGGVSALLSSEFGNWFLGVAFSAVAILIITAHVMETRKSGDLGTTTEFSMMLTFVLAAWAAVGFYMYALVTSVVVVALLSMKPVLHRWLRNIETEEIYAGVKLLVISVIFLPLLPDKGYGPYEALNPYWIWWMVVLICGISFAGYFAIKFIGNRLGTIITSITGGLASSTAVTISLAQFAKDQPQKALFMGGVMIATSIMFIRVTIEVAVVNVALISDLWIPLSIMFFSVLLGGYWLWNKNDEISVDTELNLDNPFKIGMALKFGVLLALILLLTEGMKNWFGDQGIYILSLVSGLMDADAITLSLSRQALGDLENGVATLGIIIASAMNTIVKGFIFAFFSGFKKSLKFILLLFACVLPGLIAAFLMLYF
ncbi:MAG: MgtC/SapB family protein [Balneolaceae bacterium]|nr:MgtC/SapB family protein [Balneolaceae bacterium]